MRIKILSSAVDDLHSGRLFYENQGEGLGEYFLDSLFSDIDSLVLYAGIHPMVSGYGNEKVLTFAKKDFGAGKEGR